LGFGGGINQKGGWIVEVKYAAPLHMMGLEWLPVYVP
jgi:hypothetical protein